MPAILAYGLGLIRGIDKISIFIYYTVKGCRLPNLITEGIAFFKTLFMGGLYDTKGCN
jgi:hypothetical protein